MIFYETITLNKTSHCTKFRPLQWSVVGFLVKLGAIEWRYISELLPVKKGANMLDDFWAIGYPSVHLLAAEISSIMGECF